MRRFVVPAVFAVVATLAFPSVTCFKSSAADAAKTFEIENNRLKVPGPVLYETGSDRIKPESEPTLNHVKAYLDEKSYITLLRIEVHSDNSGSEEANQTLTEKRAMAVAKSLVSKGIDCKRLIAVGFGSTKPVASNDTPENKAQNRRTEFINAALRDRPIGGMPVDGGGKVAGDVCK